MSSTRRDHAQKTHAMTGMATMGAAGGGPGPGAEQVGGPPGPAAATASAAAPPVAPYAHFVAGGVGGMVSGCFTAPLDVVKTRLQSDFYRAQIEQSRVARGVAARPAQLSLPRSAALHVRETVQILFRIHRVEGGRALFKGVGPILTGVVPARAINFWAYGNGKRVIAEQAGVDEGRAWVQLAAASVAGVVTGTATNPIWLIKTRLQLDQERVEGRKTPGGGKTAEASPGGKTAPRSRQYSGSLDCVRQVLRHEGIRGLYRGLSASYLGVSESTLQWVLYEQGKVFLRGADGGGDGGGDGGADGGADGVSAKALQTVTSAGGAKFVAALATYPHEVVRTRLRQAPSGAAPRYTGLVQCFRLVWREEGMVGLYGGLTPHLMRVVPNAAIMFGTYELVLSLLSHADAA